MTYKPANPPADGSLLKIALVGKGLTFDTGGYNLKLSGMETMKLDVGGCAAILGCAKAISQLRPRVCAYLALLFVGSSHFTHSYYRRFYVCF